MNIVNISAKTLTLSSGLQQESFAKAHLIELLSKKSTLVHIKNDSIFSEEYTFSGTKMEENGITVFEGDAVPGKTLSDILSLARDERTIFALSSFSCAIDFLLNQGTSLEAVGAGGIVVNADEKAKTAEILFINSELFETCAQNHKDFYADLQGKYLHKGLDSQSSLLFMRAVSAYKSLCSHFPFENNDTTKRQEDIFDSAFIPIELWDESIDKNISENIHAAFSLKIKNEMIAGKRSLLDAKSEQKRQKTLKKALEFKSELFFKELKRITNNDNKNGKLSENRLAFVKKMNRILSVKRFLRRNKNRILAGGAAIFIAAWFVSGFVRENAKLITTKGLDSVQTTHALYAMIHRSDVPNLQEIISGKETKDLLTKVSGYFVSAKQRLEVSPDNGVQRPAHWLFYKKESKDWMLGITNLRIDGKSFRIEGDYPKRKDKPAPIQEENGKTLQKGDEITHKAEYFFVHQAEAKFYIEKMNDEVTLRWTGKQWRVVKVNGKSKIESVKAKDFIEEYYSLAESGVRAATEKLREKYDWFPSEEDITDAAQVLLSEYDSIEAAKYLNSK